MPPIVSYVRKLAVSMSFVGRVAEIWRYPVKSMMGEELNAAEVTEAGLL